MCLSVCPCFAMSSTLETTEEQLSLRSGTQKSIYLLKAFQGLQDSTWRWRRGLGDQAWNKADLRLRGEISQRTFSVITSLQEVIEQSFAFILVGLVQQKLVATIAVRVVRLDALPNCFCFPTGYSVRLLPNLFVDHFSRWIKFCPVGWVQVTFGSALPCKVLLGTCTVLFLQPASEPMQTPKDVQHDFV